MKQFNENTLNALEDLISDKNSRMTIDRIKGRLKTDLLMLETILAHQKHEMEDSLCEAFVRADNLTTLMYDTLNQNYEGYYKELVAVFSVQFREVFSDKPESAEKVLNDVLKMEPEEVLLRILSVIASLNPNIIGQFDVNVGSVTRKVKV